MILLAPRANNWSKILTKSSVEIETGVQQQRRFSTELDIKNTSGQASKQERPTMLLVRRRNEVNAKLIIQLGEITNRITSNDNRCSTLAGQKQ